MEISSQKCGDSEKISAFLTTDKPYYKKNSSPKCINLLATFFFEAKGAKKKVIKKETP
jgi:hypothetical protein